jgi:hypothetical protein
MCGFFWYSSAVISLNFGLQSFELLHLSAVLLSLTTRLRRGRAPYPQGR